MSIKQRLPTDRLLRTSRVPWSSYCSSMLESHSPPLASGLYRLHQTFTQHRKVLQDCLYVGHHHKLPTSRHHHASLYVGCLKNQRISLSWVSQKHKVGGSVDRYMSPNMYLTQGHTDMHTHREPCAHTQQCVDSHWSAYLKGLGLEAGGLPEDTNHLPTMLVIEEKRQISKGLLAGTEHKRDYNKHLGPPPWFQRH